MVLNSKGETTSGWEHLDPRVRKRIDEWRERLVDISRRNRLLYYKPTKRQSLEILAPDLQEVSDKILRSGQWKFWFPAGDELDVEVEDLTLDVDKAVQKVRSKDELETNNRSTKELYLTLESLFRRSSADYQERGVRILHLALGLLNWRDPESKEDVRSPLLLIPVELERKAIGQPFILKLSDEEPVVNPTLTVKLQRDFNVTLPEIEGSLEAGDDDDYDLSTFFDAVEQLNAAWRVDRSCILGLFTFYKEVIYKDLTVNWSTALSNDFVGALARGESVTEPGDPLPDPSQLDQIQSPHDTLAVLDADSSQRMCLEAARRGKSFVVQGPPGTGKSQTIANLIAQSIADGKSVLFVSEKMAALEVVYKRLAEVGLGEFCLELHSHKANKREVAETLGKALRSRVKDQRALGPEDLDRLQALREHLNNYVLALHEERQPIGWTPYFVLGRLAQLSDVATHVGPIIDSTTTTVAAYNRLRSTFDVLVQRWTIAEEGEAFVWRDLQAEAWNAALRQSLKDNLTELWAAFTLLRSSSRAYASSINLPHPRTVREAARLCKLADFLDNRRSVPVSWLTGESDLSKLLDEAERYRGASGILLAHQRQLASAYSSAPSTAAAKEYVKSTAALALPPNCFDSGQEAIAGILRQLQTAAAVGHKCMNTVITTMGLDIDRARFQRVSETLDIARILIEDSRPLPIWLSAKRLRDAASFVERVRPSFEREAEITNELAASWGPGFVDVAGPIAQRFISDSHRSLSSFRTQHSNDRKSLKAHSKSGKLPSSTVSDVALAAEARDIRAKIAALDPEGAIHLATYWRGLETNLPLISDRVLAAHKLLDVTDGLSSSRLEACLSQELSSGFEAAIDGAEQALSQCAVLMQNWTNKTSQSFSPSSFKELEVWATDKADLLAKLTRAWTEVQNVRNGRASAEQLVSEAKSWIDVADIRLRFGSVASELEEKFPLWKSDPGGDWDAICDSLRWAQRVAQSFGALPGQTAKTVVDHNFVNDPADLERARVSASTSAAQLLGTFKDAGRATWLDKLGAAWEDASAWLETATERLDEARSWIDYSDACAVLSGCGWGDFLARLVANPPPADLVKAAFERAFLTAWLEDVFRRDPRLGKFQGRDHEALILDFRKLDAQLIEHAREEVIRACNALRPKDFGIPNSQVAIVRTEAGKKRRHRPVRKLFEEIPELLLQLKPCLLMSPLSVSQFLSPDLRFDLAIFDEASQVTVEDAVCALYRADQHVIAGDPKQLPPSSFFSVGDGTDDGDDDDDVASSWESILDRADSAGLRFVPLRWHYRSRHESLIAYSNRAFYESDLITFPSSWHEHPGLGIKFEYVEDGVYDRGGSRTNRKEAKRVAEIVFDQFTRHPGKSVGVVTFSQTQMTAILDEIDQFRYAHREFEKVFDDDRLDGFFVKNLENVQGDERDIMVFSVGYGKDASGAFSTNFGPLNKEKGERRLNVAITRAREKVVLVSSIGASDFPMGADLKPGVLHLRNYLDFAQRGVVALLGETSGVVGDFESDFEAAVAAEIRELGLEVVPQVGVGGFRIDLGVLHPHEPGRFLAGVECDGFQYHSSVTARDRDRLRQEVLENLGWNIIRVWSPDWNENRPRCVQRLKVQLEKALDASFKGRSVATVVQREVEEVDSEGASLKTLPHVVSYPYQSIRSAHRPGVPFHELSERRAQVRFLEDLVRAEQPVTIEYVRRRLKAAWRVKREGPLIAGACDQAVALALRTGKVERKIETLFVAGSPWEKQLRIRIPDDRPESFRDLIQEIPVEEVQLALKTIVEQAPGIARATLIQQTSRLFGNFRTGSRISDRIEEILEPLVETDQIRDFNAQLVLGARSDS